MDHVQGYTGKPALSWSQIPFLAMGLAPAQSLHNQNAYGRNVEQVQISACTQSFSYSPTPFIVINMHIKGLLRSTPESTRPCWSGFAHPVSAPLRERKDTVWDLRCDVSIPVLSFQDGDAQAVQVWFIANNSRKRSSPESQMETAG